MPFSRSVNLRLLKYADQYCQPCLEKPGELLSTYFEHFEHRSHSQLKSLAKSSVCTFDVARQMTPPIHQ
jgi:hypothetical protein